LEKGRTLEALGRFRAARKQYTKAIRVHPSHANAYSLRAKLSLQDGDKASAVDDLERCLYYDNTRVDAHFLAQTIRAGHQAHPSPPAEWGNTLSLRVEPEKCDLVKGDTISLEVSIFATSDVPDCSLELLEPFGWGVEATPSKVAFGPVKRGWQTKASIQVKAKRASEVNLGQRWVLNVLLSGGSCCVSKLLHFGVTDPAEGRVFLVLTNDHEPRPLAGEKWTDGKLKLACDLFQRQVPQNGELAQKLADRYGMKWTHMVDAGGALALPRWAAKRDPAWKAVWEMTQAHYAAALAQNHDCQMHLHLSGVPTSSCFSYDYAVSEGALFFDVKKRRSVADGKRVSSWANATPRFGRTSNQRSRVGSLAQGKRDLQSVLGAGAFPWRPVLFRAGQWDLGATTSEREKSIMALRECGFLADSSVAEGYSCYQGPFRFGCPPAQAARFTFRNNPEKQAPSLADAGLLEVVPISLPQGRHPMNPRADHRAVIQAYRRLLHRGRVVPGRHVLMEIEHLSEIADGTRDGHGLGNGGWGSMRRHFKAVRRHCPALECVGAAQAIQAWLDHYSPELIARLSAPRMEPGAPGGGLVFPLSFLGEGILGRTVRRHHVSIPLPMDKPDGSKRIVVVERGKPLLVTSAPRANLLAVDLELSEENCQHFAIAWA
jgi:tetratricopeptide (TPR) repeat protein